MKKTVYALCAVMAVSLLSACELTGPRLRLKPPITVDTGGDHHDGHRDRHHKGDHDHDNDGDFCPPGQAKKGRC